jgi:L-cysteine:1D-myo-inositol 2-amino-2-deoxy-alpha-D-glucopyranoside ligase
MTFQLYDTARRAIVPFEPDEHVLMYTCGITPYDATHLGHAFTYVTFDLIHRVWLDAGHEVVYVQNVTDIDDPLLERAVATGQDWRELAAKETELYRADMAALHVLPPTHYLGAVESMELVVAAVRSLRTHGATYHVDGDEYFAVESDDRFGDVARLPEQEMRALSAERGGDPDRPGKRHPLDPLLWQAARPDEPAWDTELGHGRPGWHVECTAIALEHLGMTFDVQGGGRDLVYPHHEMCASLAHVATGRHPFARRFVHAGLVGLDGHKMSKSRGNLVFVSRMRDQGVDPNAIRLALLAHHYRADWEWTADELEAALQRLSLWSEAVHRDTGPSAASLLDEVRGALADDLDSPAALRAMDHWAQRAGRGHGDDPSAPALAADVATSLLGVTLGQDSGSRRRR